MAKIPIVLKNPDKILLVYGDDTIELQNNTDFSKYIVTIDSKDLHKYKKYLYKKRCTLCEMLKGENNE